MMPPPLPGSASPGEVESVLPWPLQPFGPELYPYPDLSGFPDLDLPSTGEALGYGRQAWSLIPYKQKSAILAAGLLVARRHPVIAGATLGLAAIRGGQAIGAPAAIAGSGAAARRRLLPETVEPLTTPATTPEPLPTVPEALEQRARDVPAWLRKRAAEARRKLEEQLPSGPVYPGGPLQ